MIFFLLQRGHSFTYLGNDEFVANRHHDIHQKCVAKHHLHKTTKTFSCVLLFERQLVFQKDKIFTHAVEITRIPLIESITSDDLDFL